MNLSANLHDDKQVLRNQAIRSITRAAHQYPPLPLGLNVEGKIPPHGIRRVPFGKPEPADDVGPVKTDLAEQHLYQPEHFGTFGRQVQRPVAAVPWVQQVFDDFAASIACTDR